MPFDVEVLAPYSRNRSFCWYNWIRKHKTLKTTPAVAAGLTDEILDMTYVVRLIDAREALALADKRRAVLDHDRKGVECAIKIQDVKNRRGVLTPIGAMLIEL